MTFFRKRYPPTWFTEIRPAVLERAQNRCEGSPAHPDCRAENHQPHPVTGSRVILTCAHIYDNDTHTTDITRIVAQCQRCHLSRDRHKHLQRAAQTRARKRGQLPLLEETG